MMKGGQRILDPCCGKTTMKELNLIGISERGPLVDWVNHTAAHIRKIVGETPSIRLMPYRSNIVAMDFFERPNLSGKSFALTAFVSPNEGYLLNNPKPSEISTEISVSSGVDILLLASLLWKQMGQKTPIPIFIAI